MGLKGRRNQERTILPFQPPAGGRRAKSPGDDAGNAQPRVKLQEKVIKLCETAIQMRQDASNIKLDPLPSQGGGDDLTALLPLERGCRAQLAQAE